MDSTHRARSCWRISHGGRRLVTATEHNSEISRKYENMKIFEKSTQLLAMISCFCLADDHVFGSWTEQRPLTEGGSYTMQYLSRFQPRILSANPCPIVPQSRKERYHANNPGRGLGRDWIWERCQRFQSILRKSVITSTRSPGVQTSRSQTSSRLGRAREKRANARTLNNNDDDDDEQQ